MSMKVETIIAGDVFDAIFIFYSMMSNCPWQCTRDSDIGDIINVDDPDIISACEISDEECIINCIDPSSCFASNINCNENTICNINCIDEDSCLKSKIQCPTSADCIINGLNSNSLTQAIIQCPTDNISNCETNCDSTTSCRHTLIDGLGPTGTRVYGVCHIVIYLYISSQFNMI